jgi:phosphoglycolate phosphatase-like HAD superfamily hydrolase
MSSDRPPAVVLDLDGVLADTRHRMRHLHRRPKDWDAFFAAAHADPVHPEGLETAREAAGQGREVVYLSGRPERTRADTLAWLEQAGAPPGEVVLRPEGDRRPARTVKVAALRRLSRRLRLDVLVDDDPDVVAAVRAARPPLVGEVLLADWQPRDADLHTAQEREGRT